MVIGFAFQSIGSGLLYYRHHRGKSGKIQTMLVPSAPNAFL
jgi:hypothetical protein